MWYFRKRILLLASLLRLRRIMMRLVLVLTNSRIKIQTLEVELWEWMSCCWWCCCYQRERL